MVIAEQQADEHHESREAENRIIERHIFFLS
jgi:hypothetical protein